MENILAGNKDIQVTGSQSAALTAFLQNAQDSAAQGDVNGSQYWYKLACQAAASGNHMYPGA
jgi:hypothetical protein